MHIWESLGTSIFVLLNLNVQGFGTNFRKIRTNLKNIKQKGKQAEQKAADEIKKQFLSDPELNKILKITQKKVKSGEVEYVKSKNS